MKQTSLAIATLISTTAAVDTTVAVPSTSQTGDAVWGSNIARPGVAE